MSNNEGKKLTIEEVLNLENGEGINAYRFFEKPLDKLIECRSELQKAISGIREPLFVCYYCKQKIRIRGGVSKEERKKKGSFHFAHLKDSQECHIKTSNKLTKEEVNCIKYNGAKESPLHIKLKEQIASFLRLNQVYKKEISSVKVEEVIKSQQIERNWRKPDINAFFKENHIAIELQLSTTWLSVITDRQHFYQQQGCYILWVFHRFDFDDDGRKLTYNDVIFTNHQNAYVYDEDCEWRSELENDLVLKCYFKVYSIDDLVLIDRWEMAYVTLSDLTFDPVDFKVYFKNSKKQKKEVEQSIKQERDRRALIARENEIEEEKQRILQAKLEERKREIENKRNTEVVRLEDVIINVSRQKENLEWRKGNKINLTKDIDQKLEKRIQLLTNLEDLAKNLYSSITGAFYTQSLHEYFELEDRIKGIFLDRIKNLELVINQANKDKQALIFKETNLSKFETISIAGTEYYILPNKDEFFNKLRKSFSKIKFLPKIFAQSLFAEAELRHITSEKIFMEVFFKNSVYLLIDSKYNLFSYFDQIEAKDAEIANFELQRKDLKAEIFGKLKEFIENDLATLMIGKSEKEGEIKELEAQIANFESDLKQLRINLKSLDLSI